MKYIDADLLRKEIEFAKSVYDNPKRVVYGIADDYRLDGKVAMCNEILRKLDSLQQEQESIAERFAKIVRENLIGIDKEVQQKFERLYFEVTGNKMYGGYND